VPVNGATSPYTNSFGERQRFFQLRGAPQHGEIGYGWNCENTIAEKRQSTGALQDAAAISKCHLTSREASRTLRDVGRTFVFGMSV